MILEVKFRPGLGKTSTDYPNYDKIITALSKETFESQREQGAAWIGTPDAIVQQITDYHQRVGGFEIVVRRRTLLMRRCLESGKDVSLRGAVGDEAISFHATDCVAWLAMTFR